MGKTVNKDMNQMSKRPITFPLYCSPSKIKIKEIEICS
jgi:hypothetical protein